MKLLSIAAACLLASCGYHLTIVSDTQPSVNPRAYQLQVGMDTIWMYDGTRYVGALPFSYTDNISMLVVRDNQ